MPLSFAQQRLWFLEQVHGERTAYNLPFAWRLRGPLNREALRRGLEAVVQRHEPLRTAFPTVDGEPVQDIREIQRLDLPVEDLRGLGADQQAERVASYRRQDSEKPFDLTGDLMLRASLLCLDEEEHVLLLTLHHIAADGWSLAVLWRELELLYDAFCRGDEPELPKLPVQYADYAVWRRNELEGERLERLRQYWCEQLRGMSELELPADRPRPAQPTFLGERYDFGIGKDLLDRLKLLSPAEGVTLHMTLLAAFQALLRRYSGQHDIVVGVPTAGRNHEALEGLVGFFVNTLALRTSLSGDPTFRELLGRVRESSLAAFEHQDLPFEKVVEELQSDRDPSRGPLIQAVFQLLALPDGALALRDLETSLLLSSSRRVRFDLEVELRERDGAIDGVAIYSTDLFDASTISRMTGHFLTMLEAIAADPDQRIGALPLLTEPERHRLLVEWNHTAVEYPHEKCVHELFEQQARQRPNAAALVFEQQQLSYRELNERANRLAHYLQSLGVGPQALVGLCMERSADLIVGILGILKAGAAYVPLDPGLPARRLELMVEDAKAGFLLTRQRLLDRVPVSGRQVVCLDTDDPHIQQMAQSNPSRNAGSDDLAYVMFTSGSTGQPKGVEIRHASIARLVFGNDYATFGPERVFLQLATVAFDASTFEIWGALLHGGKLVLAPAGLPDFRQLGELLERNGVTTLWLTATLFNQIVEHCPEMLAGVDEILTGGEALSVRHIRKAQDALGSHAQLINGYGPTESTTFATCYRIPPGFAGDLQSVPIGRPIGNTQVYLLDEHRQPVPIGVSGELYIGGAGLARGYASRPDLTAEKFSPNPFVDDPQARLYRTGDRCRWRSDGNLEFLGRIDGQVKLRGYRIELGEIEAALLQHPGVAHAAVMLREDRPGEKRLAAYFVPRGDATPTNDDLRRHCGESLPAYMIPAVFVALDALPLTSNGKIDRRALPAPNDARPESEGGYAAPRNPIEQLLASIWCDVLAIENVGIHDNFFALGGHSLLAVRLFAVIERESGRSFPLASLFQAPTIAQLADLLSQEGWSPQWSPLVAIQPGGSRPPLFCVHGVGGNVLAFEPLARRLGSDQPLFGLQAQGLDDRQTPHSRIEDMAACYLQEIQKVQLSGPYLFAGQSFGGTVAFEMARQLRAQGQQAALVALFDTTSGHRPETSLAGRLWYATRFLLLRIRYHVRQFWDTPSRQKLEHVRRKAKTPKRRVKTRIWQTTHGLYRAVSGKDQPLPPVLRSVKESCYLALHRYIPQVYEGRLTLFMAEEQPLSLEHDPRAGWGDLAAGGVDVHDVPGNHNTILVEPNVAVLAEKLRACIEAATTPQPHPDPP